MEGSSKGLSNTALMVGMMMSNMVVTVALVVGGFFYMRSQQSPAPQPTPSPIIQVGQIETILSGHPEDAAKVSGVFRELSQVMMADSNLVQSTQDIRQAVSVAGRLAYGDTLKGKYPQLGNAIDAIIERAVGGKTVRKLTDQDRQNVIAAFDQIANEAGRVQ